MQNEFVYANIIEYRYFALQNYNHYDAYCNILKCATFWEGVDVISYFPPCDILIYTFLNGSKALSTNVKQRQRKIFCKQTFNIQTSCLARLNIAFCFLLVYCLVSLLCNFLWIMSKKLLHTNLELKRWQ